MAPIPTHPPHPTMPQPTTPAEIQSAIDSIASKNDQIKLQRKGDKDHGIPPDVEGYVCLWCRADLPSEARRLSPGHTKVTVVCGHCRCARIGAKRPNALPAQCGRIRHVVPGSGEMHRYCYDCWLTNLRSSQKWYLKRKLVEDHPAGASVVPAEDVGSTCTLPSPTGSKGEVGQRRRKSRGKEVDRVDRDGAQRAAGSASGSGAGSQSESENSGSSSSRTLESDEEEEDDPVEYLGEGRPRGTKNTRGRSGSAMGSGNTTKERTLDFAAAKSARSRGIKIMSKEERERSRAGKELRRLQAEELIRAQMEEQLGGIRPPLEGYEGIDRRGYGFGPAPPGQEGESAAPSARPLPKRRQKRSRESEAVEDVRVTALSSQRRTSGVHGEGRVDRGERVQEFDLESLPGLDPMEVDAEIGLDSGSKDKPTPEPESTIGAPPEPLVTPSRRVSARVKTSTSKFTPSPSTSTSRTPARKAAILAKAAIAVPEKIIPSMTVPPVLARAERLAKQLEDIDPASKRSKRTSAVGAERQPMTEMEKMAAGAVAAGAQIRLAMGLEPRAISPHGRGDARPRSHLPLNGSELFAPVRSELSSRSRPIVPVALVGSASSSEARGAKSITPNPAQPSGKERFSSGASKPRRERASDANMTMKPPKGAAMAMAVTRAANAVLNETAEPSASASSVLAARTAKAVADRLGDDPVRRAEPEPKPRRIETNGPEHARRSAPTVYRPDEFVEAERQKAAKRARMQPPTGSAYPGYPMGYPSAPHVHGGQMPAGYPQQPAGYPGFAYPHPSYPSASAYYGPGQPYPYGVPGQPPPRAYPPGYPGYADSSYSAMPKSTSGGGYPPGYPHYPSPYPAYPGYPDYGPGLASAPAPYGYYAPPATRSPAAYPTAPGVYSPAYSDRHARYGHVQGYMHSSDHEPMGPRTRLHDPRPPHATSPRTTDYSLSSYASASRRESGSHTQRPSPILAVPPRVAPAPPAAAQPRRSEPSSRRQRSRNPDSESDSASEDISEDERARSRRRARGAHQQQQRRRQQQQQQQQRQQTAHAASIAHAQALAAGRSAAYPSSPPPLNGGAADGDEGGMDNQPAKYAYPSSPGASHRTLDGPGGAQAWQDIPFNT